MNKPIDHKRVDEILNSLDGIKQANPRPFFYGRTMNRLKQSDGRWEKMVGLLSKPAIAFATVTLFLAINVVVLFHSSGTATRSSQDESTVVGDNEYNNLSVSSLYDINPDQNDVAQK